MDQQLFVFTAGSQQAYQHYIDTIEEGFSIDSIGSFITPKMQSALKAIYGQEKAKAWGAVPGPKNVKNWEKMQIGDRVLIYRKGYYEYYATVCFKVHNKELAKHLWNTNAYVEHEETWEFIYFLKDLTEISVPTIEYNKLLLCADNYFPQGFGLVGRDKIEHICKNFVSIDGFLKALEEGAWINKSQKYPESVKTEMLKERYAKVVSKTNLSEQNLENFIADRIESIEPGLKLVGRQIDTKEVGRLDLLCEDKNGNLIVVELKKMKAGPSIIDQIQRYMGWIMTHKARKGQDVGGIIVVGKKDTALEYAAKANPKIKVKMFNISFT